MADRRSYCQQERCMAKPTGPCPFCHHTDRKIGEDAVGMYNAGASLSWLARHFNCSDRGVAAFLERRGVTLRARGGARETPHQMIKRLCSSVSSDESIAQVVNGHHGIDVSPERVSEIRAFVAAGR